MELKTSNKSENMIIYAQAGADLDEARRLSLSLHMELTQEREIVEMSDLVLVINRDGLTLTADGLEMRADFQDMVSRLKIGNVRNELLVRASKVKNKEEHRTAIDATAGLGEDAILLAAAGFSVTMYELNPVIAALLQDALQRAKYIPELSDIVNRMRLVQEDSIYALSHMTESVDIVLLDPMFPERKKSALVKKKFQLIHQLEFPCTNEEELLQAAFHANPYKIVIKRPEKGPYLADRKPDYSLKGKAIRYDCIVLPPAKQ